MNKLLMQWFRGLGLSFCLLIASHSFVLADAGTDAGNTSGNSVLHLYGSQSGSNSNISVPLTDGATMMKSVDGSKTFAGNISAPSSNKFLQMLIQPSSTGDLSLVKVMQDLDMDGTLEYVYTVPFPVSGVCANGVISCSPGTWSDCAWYKWVADPATLGVSLASVSGAVVDPDNNNGTIQSLGGCYCINSFCGSNLAWTNSQQLLRDLGGGVISSINSTDVRLMITNVTVDLVTASYYGNIITEASTAPTGGNISSAANSATVQGQKNYFSNPLDLDSYRDTVAANYGGDPGSFYYKIENSVAANTGAAQQQCSIVRNAVITSTPVASFSNTGSSAICTDHWVYMMVDKVDDITYKLKLVDTGPGGLGTMHHNCGDDPGGDHWHLQHVINLPAETATYQAELTKAYYSITNIHGGGCITGGTMSMDGVSQGFNTAIQGSAPCPASGAQTAYFDWSYLFEFTTDEYTETVSNGCTTYESDPNCSLQAAVTDGVTVMRNYAMTGLNPMASCREFVGLVKNMVVCRDWWEQKKTYVCANTLPDLSAVGSRYGTVVNSLTDGGSSIYFNDNMSNNGTWSTSSEVLAIGLDRTLPQGCDQVCKVKKTSVEDSQVAAASVVSEQRVNSLTDVMLYRQCIDGVCQLESGETLESNCSCVDGTADFGRSASIMQMMRLAGGDKMCSSGNLH